MGGKETQEISLGGVFNTNRIVENDKGGFVLERIPKNNPQVLEDIRKEYSGIGFIDAGGSVKLRSPDDQYIFTSDLSKQGFRVLAPLSINGEILTYPFVKAKGLNVHFKGGFSAHGKALGQLFEDLESAHESGVVYGDRWLPNILFSDETGIVHIDFDLSISGRYAKEFEVSQVLYYILLYGKLKTCDWLQNFFQYKNTWFQEDVVSHFLQGHANYFEGTEYEDRGGFVVNFNKFLDKR